MNSEPTITRGDLHIALEIMRGAAVWLNENGKAMWRLEDLTPERILTGITVDEIYVGWVDGKAAAAMILQWNDPVFWPGVIGDSGFVHKLCVRREFAGTGLSRQMIEWAWQEAERRGKKFLRLDCAADRPSLCSFYESIGFRRVDRRMVGSFDAALYQVSICQRGENATSE